MGYRFFKRCTWLFLALIYAPSAFANTWFVAASGSNDTANGQGLSPEKPLKTIEYAFNTAAKPGDTILVMAGVYRNSGYGSGELNNGPVAHLNNSGRSGKPIVLKAFPGHQPVIEFDGSGGFIANEIRHIEISGFVIRGPGQNINVADALAQRLTLPRPAYYNGRGIAIWGPADHITISGNIVHDCPASGIRVNKGDYITIAHNQVYRNTRYTSTAESALVIAEAQSIDQVDDIKIRIENNMTWDNQNLIPFFTPRPPDVGIEKYGTAQQDYIIDGSGIYMTRNKSYKHGWFYLANNISFNNGINGLVVHRTDRAIVINNTSYMNGATPLDKGRQSSSGITLNNAEHVRVFNNISWARYPEDFALGRYGRLKDVIIDANIIYGGISGFDEGFIFADPLFVNARTEQAKADFSLQPQSPAIGAGVLNEYAPRTDFFGNYRRPEAMDIGAVAFVE